MPRTRRKWPTIGSVVAELIGVDGQPLSRSYQAAERNRYYSNIPRTQGPNTELDRASRIMFSDARWLEENHDVAVALLDEFTDGVLGNSLELIPLPLDRNGKFMEEFASDILELFEEWQKRPEVTWSLHWQDLLRLAVSSAARDGEMFARHIVGNRRTAPWPDGALPYMVQTLEAEFCDFDLYHDASPIIMNGVETNQWGRARAYHMWRQHPDENIFLMSRQKMDRRRIPAEQIVHYKHVRRFGQLRGATLFSSVSSRMRDVKDIEESERLAVRVNSKAVLAIERHPDLYEAYMERKEAGATDSERTLEFESGSIWDDLLPGESVKGIKSERPNPDLVPYNREQLRRICAGFGVKYSNVARDWSGTYSTQRQELVEMRHKYGVKREHAINHLVQPVYQMVLNIGVLTGRLRVPRAADRARMGLFEISASPIPWIQPEQEIDAAVKEIEAGLVSQETVRRERGRKRGELDQIKREKAEREPLEDESNEQDDQTARDANAQLELIASN